MSKQDGGPAFPRPCSTQPAYPDCEHAEAFEGMSLRQFYAGLAMQGFISHGVSDGRASESTVLARAAFDVADALIAAEQEQSS